MTTQTALAYLNTLINYEQSHQPQAMRAVSLERMRQLCERLGAPQRRFRSILVAGTNGKGSICAMLYSILRHAGLRVGLYTSPHLVGLYERIRVSQGNDGQGIDTDELEDADWMRPREVASLMKRLQPVVQDINRASTKSPLTYFEVLTAMAFLHFAQQDTEVAILEVGLGGRLDATNVVEQEISIIGPIGLDHTDVLGEDIAMIAREKAGILKPSSRLVLSASQSPDVGQVLHGAALVHGCRLLEYGRHLSADIVTQDVRGTRLNLRTSRGAYEGLTMPLLGRHQAENAALAVAAVEALSDDGIPHAAVRSGLATVRWPGRLEVVGERPLVVLDGAHNPPAAQALKTALEDVWPGRAIHVVVGMSADKSLEAVAGILGPLAASVVCTQSRHPRASDPNDVACAWTPRSRTVRVIPDPADAYTYLLNTVGPDEVIVVTGSLFLVGEVRALLEKAKGQTRPRTRAPILDGQR